jgi:hypothetical protein
VNPYHRLILTMDANALAGIIHDEWAKQAAAANHPTCAAQIKAWVDERLRDLADIELLRDRPEAEQ